MVLVLAFAFAFVRDGWWGYPRKNAAALVATLGLDQPPPQPDPELTSHAAEAYIERLSPGDSDARVVEVLGPPDLRHNQSLYYVGPGGHLQIEMTGGRLSEMAWLDAAHSEADIQVQKIIAAMLIIVSIFVLIRWIRLVTMRLRVTEEELIVPGEGRVARGRIQSVRPMEEGPERGFHVHHDRGGKEEAITISKLDFHQPERIFQALTRRPVDPESPA